MSKNLDVDKFRNGDPIPKALDNEEWNIANENKAPIYCHVEFTDKNQKKYGKIYNWYAVSDPRGLAPDGWHIPSKQEWTELINYTNKSFPEYAVENDTLFSTPFAYAELFKSKYKLDWPNEDESLSQSSERNKTGFNAIPSGYCSWRGKYMNQDFYAYWWSSTSNGNSDNAWCFVIEGAELKCNNSVEEEIARNGSSVYSENGAIDKEAYDNLYNSLIEAFGTLKMQGLSVRCIKD
jgi:uncharacterized protein (TIGR02145 family)